MSTPTVHIARYGGIAFDCISTSDGVPQNKPEHTFPRKNGAHIQPMGTGARRTRLSCIFFEVAPIGDTSGLNYLERYQIFYSKINSGEAHEFVHPIFGSYRAHVVGEISTEARSEELDVLMVECTFAEDTTQPSPFEFAESALVDVGISAVKVAAEKMNQALAAEGITSTVATDSVDSVSAWRTSDTVTTRQVNLELQSMSSEIAALAAEYELATNLARQPLWRSTQRLHGEIRKSARLFQQRQPNIFNFTTGADIPLRVLAVELYGAENADKRYEELLLLNDIDDPMLIPRGTKMKANSPDTERAKGLRSA